jgi:hypothetical protein
MSEKKTPANALAELDEDAFINGLAWIMQEKKLTNKECGDAAGIHWITVSRRLNRAYGCGKFKQEEREALADAVGLAPDEFAKMAKEAPAYEPGTRKGWRRRSESVMERRRQVMEMSIAGMSCSEIAEKLDVPKTKVSDDITKVLNGEAGIDGYDDLSYEYSDEALARGEVR